MISATSFFSFSFSFFFLTFLFALSLLYLYLSSLRILHPTASLLITIRTVHKFFPKLNNLKISVMWCISLFRFLFIAQALLLNQTLVDRFHDHLHILREIIPMDLAEISNLRESIDGNVSFPESSTLVPEFPVNSEGLTLDTQTKEELPITEERPSVESGTDLVTDRLEKLEALLELLIGKLANRENTPSDQVEVTETLSLQAETTSEHQTESESESYSSVQGVENVTGETTEMGEIPDLSLSEVTTTYDIPSSSALEPSAVITSLVPEPTEEVDVIESGTDLNSEIFPASESSSLPPDEVSSQPPFEEVPVQSTEETIPEVETSTEKSPIVESPTVEISTSVEIYTSVESSTFLETSTSSSVNDLVFTSEEPTPTAPDVSPSPMPQERAPFDPTSTQTPTVGDSDRTTESDLLGHLSSPPLALALDPLGSSELSQPTEIHQTTQTQTRKAPRRPSNLNHVLNQKKPPNRIGISPQFQFHDKDPKNAPKGVYAKPKEAWYGPSAPKATAAKPTSSEQTSTPSSSSELETSESHTVIQNEALTIVEKQPLPQHEDLERRPGEDLLDYFRRVFPSVQKALESEELQHEKTSTQNVQAPSFITATPSIHRFADSSIVTFRSRTKLPKANFDQLPLMLERSRRRRNHSSLLQLERTMENVAVTFVGYSSIVAAVIFAMFVTVL